MSEPFVGEIRCFSFPFVPKGWASCNGQLLRINENPALYSILGTTYGGDGRTTFALPDLRGRVPVHTGYGVTLGQRAGEETHTLIVSEIPMHTHIASANSEPANTHYAEGTVWGKPASTGYSDQTNTVMSGQALSMVGSSQAHPNMQPYNVANYCIAILGLYPSQN